MDNINEDEFTGIKNNIHEKINPRYTKDTASGSKNGISSKGYVPSSRAA
jgi:hypothetical protein